MPRMGEGESFAGRGQGGPQAAARSAASGLRPLKPPGGRLGLRPKPVPCSDLPSPEMDFYHAIKWTRYLGAAKSRWARRYIAGTGPI